ncbi:DUF6158 family protein [Streptomyces sp. NPDC088354]|uniref:DUF6158 family protein n=1 Tax=unclassified Streptomyces TaxID=2593676 RepID=UPI0029B706F7|nr:DUF6158 family protein [Streptomyces sp. MI02-7b]MDX3077578.1 DUF6158 family protein [Streptomyces sp. MI02-7b]
MSPYRGGVDPAELDERQLVHELESVHRTRHETLLYGSPSALDAHNSRMVALEGEYLRRHPQRMVAPGRTRAGARARVLTMPAQSASAQ